jgi:hypothetical protein
MCHYYHCTHSCITLTTRIEGVLIDLSGTEPSSFVLATIIYTSTGDGTVTLGTVFVGILIHYATLILRATCRGFSMA